MESGGSLTVTVTRTGGSDGAVTVDFAANTGTATAGTDYTATTGRLIFAAGVITASFVIPIVNDGENEPNETVNLALSNPLGGACSARRAAPC